jgi:16S rRNA (guanine966-N2)-methyltransferase
MRIVAGSLRGRALTPPKDERTRPTSDRVREAMFNILAHGAASVDLTGAHVIDLFAGTGALGLEALSRGAAFGLFVEDDPSARATIRSNIEAFGLTGQTKIFRRDATDLGGAAQMGQYDVAFLDPPYDLGLGERGLASLAAGGWLKPNAVIVLEERTTATITLPAGFTLLDQRTWGDTQAVFARWQL